MKRMVGFATWLTLASTALSNATAQVTLDVAKISCDQYVLFQVADPQNIAIWLSGYYNGKRGTTILDVQGFKESARQLTLYCRANPDSPVLNAFEAVFEKGK
jgi:acid stress chaperone HdeB